MPHVESELLQGIERGGYRRLLSGLAARVQEFFIHELDRPEMILGDPPFPIESYKRDVVVADLASEDGPLTAMQVAADPRIAHAANDLLAWKNLGGYQYREREEILVRAGFSEQESREKQAAMELASQLYGRAEDELRARREQDGRHDTLVDNDRARKGI